MRNAKILAIGMTALANEVLKNIVLAGVGHVTLLDEEKVKVEDLGAQFLLREQDIGKNVSLEISHARWLPALLLD
jgi:ubiquitin-like 1-activating enzyme E1 A